MKSRSRRSSSKPPERARSPAGGAAQKRRTTVQQRRQRTRAQMRLGAAPFLRKTRLIPYPARRKKKCKNQSKAVFRPYPADRPLESGAAEKRARPPNPARMCRTAAHEGARLFGRIDNQPEGGAAFGRHRAFASPVRRPVGVGTDMRAGATERFCLVLRCAPRRTIEINTRYTRGSAIEHQQLRQRVGPVRQSVRVCAQ